MAKKKPDEGEKPKARGGAHKAPRRAVQMPAAWLDIADRLAEKRRQPTTWLLCGLIEELAKAEGVADLPPGPWEAAAPKE